VILYCLESVYLQTIFIIHEQFDGSHTNTERRKHKVSYFMLQPSMYMR